MSEIRDMIREEMEAREMMGLDNVKSDLVKNSFLHTNTSQPKNEPHGVVWLLGN